MAHEFNRVITAKILEVIDLTGDETEFIRRAFIARQSAQAPYSNYWVGAVVESESGRVYVGCNVERCTLTQTTHAEQNAIDNTVAAEGSAKIKRIAIVGGPSHLKINWPPAKAENKSRAEGEISVPCGHCLQIIWENCCGDENVEMSCFNLVTGAVTKITIGNAFPFKFGPKDLGVDYKNPARQ